MSQVDEDKLSETAEEQEDAVVSGKLVPVTESIRYRKRAQSAEKKNEELSAELEQTKAGLSDAAEQINSIKVEQKLMRKLSAAGATDLEAAVLLVKARVEGSSDADLDVCIEQLKKEKQYLFGEAGCRALTVKRTSGARERAAGNQGILERAAKRASGTGDRRDLQEYLKLRRNYI